MSAIVQAALAGYAIAIVTGQTATRVEAWWQPTWRISRWSFLKLRDEVLVAAVAAVPCAGGSFTAHAAAAATAWLIAQCYVLLLVAVRR